MEDFSTPPLAPIPFTRAAYVAMQQEFHRLTALRIEVMERLKTAREMGDLSENGGYKYAKFELGNIGRELRRLRYLLRFGEVPKHQSPTGIAEFGSTITLKGSDKTLTFLLVSEYESNPAEKKLSLKSPIGMAVLGKKMGDSVAVSSPSGITHYLISAIE